MRNMIEIFLKILITLFRPYPHEIFHKDLFISSLVILNTFRQANEHTQKHNLLGRDNYLMPDESALTNLNTLAVS